VAPKSNNHVQVRGARVHNLKNIDVDIPRDSLVVFTGVSGSGKSSLAFSTLFAEAQHRYLDSVSPYARRLIDQVEEPDVDSIEGLPPAVALHQQRGAPSARSSVGSVTTISNALRMLFSRAGDYPAGQSIIYADGFSPNTPQGACETCHGIGHVFDVSEKTLVPDDSLSIRDGAIAAWPGAWQGKNLVRVLLSLDIDVDVPWNTLPKKTRDWVLYTDERPQVPAYRNYNLEQTRAAFKHGEPASYKGTFISARNFVLETFKTTTSQRTKQRVTEFLNVSACPECAGKKLQRAALSVTFAGYDIAEMSNLTIDTLAGSLEKALGAASEKNDIPDQQHVVMQRIVGDLLARIKALQHLGLGYLSLDRSTPTLSPGELQRLRLATQLRSKLFGVVYVLDEPSAGLHPADTEALLTSLDELVKAGNSVFVVEHDPHIIEHANWIIDIGPQAGSNGGELVYSGPVKALASIAQSQTAAYLFSADRRMKDAVRTPLAWLTLRALTRNNLEALDVSFPLGVLTTVTGVSGSGKSTLVSQALVELVQQALGQKGDDNTLPESEAELLEQDLQIPTSGHISSGIEHIKRLVVVNQKPIGRTPRSNLATYTGLFDHVRKLFANTPEAKAKKYDSGRFSFNVAKGRCANCDGVGFVSVELLFMPSVYASCPACQGARYNDATLDIRWKGKTIADVLHLTVSEAAICFAEEAPIKRALDALLKVGLGYLRLGQPATELSGGEAQRIKLATELQRTQQTNTLYILDEPTTGLHPADVTLLMTHLNALTDAGNTVILVEHDMRVARNSDHIIDIGPEAGYRGGKIVAQGTPAEVAKSTVSKTARFMTK